MTFRKITIVLTLALVITMSTVMRVYAEDDEGEEDDDRFEQTQQQVPLPTTITPAPTAEPVSVAPIVTPPATETPAPTSDDSVAAPIAQPIAVVKQPSSWPWYITRSFGIASYLLLFASALIGILMTTGAMHRVVSPTAAWSLHRTTGIFLILSITVHLAALVFDHFINLHIVDILIPFVSPFQPLLMALGIFGLYLFIPVIWTSLRWIDRRTWLWRVTHFLSFPMFLLIFFHALLIGTDRHQPWMLAIFWLTGGTMALLILYRLAWKLLAGRR